MKKIKWITVMIAVLAFTGVCYGASFTWTDTTSGEVGNVYTLDLSESGGVYSATFKAFTINDPVWYIDFIGIKLDENVAGVTISGPPAPWAAYDNYLNTWNYYAVWFSPTTLAQVDDGLQLNGTTYTGTFSFTLASALSQEPSLHIGYFDGFAGQSGNIRFTQMSQKPDRVPEPTTLLLLGLGLVGLAGISRRLKK